VEFQVSLTLNHHVHGASNTEYKKATTTTIIIYLIANGLLPSGSGYNACT